MKFSPLATVRSAIRNSAEAYYLHLAGAQQGPYTIPQIDHLVNSGLIGEETLYWCEGLDQWQPVTTLVVLRKVRPNWMKRAIIAGVLLALVVPLWIFGPILIDGWQEANQHEFTSTAAYWRARDVVRTELHTQGLLVQFAGEAECPVTMGTQSAEVKLHGSATDAARKSTAAVWRVAMVFDPGAEEWSGTLPVTSGTPERSGILLPEPPLPQ